MTDLPVALLIVGFVSVNTPTSFMPALRSALGKIHLLQPWVVRLEVGGKVKTYKQAANSRVHKGVMLPTA